MGERLDALFAQRVAAKAFLTHPYFRIAALDVLEAIGRNLAEDEAFRTRVPELVERGLDVAALFGGGVHCYFIDESERHLHPSVARKAARWLREVMTEREAQCVLTTHSVPFLDLGDAGAYNYLWRQGGRIFSLQFDPDSRHAFSLLAEEMGFDRGELLTTVRQLLFVEGRADQIVLEALFGCELRRFGVAVVPFHGVGGLHAPSKLKHSFDTPRLTSLCWSTTTSRSSFRNYDATRRSSKQRFGTRRTPSSKRLRSCFGRPTSRT